MCLKVCVSVCAKMHYIYRFFQKKSQFLLCVRTCVRVRVPVYVRVCASVRVYVHVCA